MSMIFCRGCGKEIHETAVTCPLCGAPQSSTPADPGKKNSKARRPMWAKILIVIVALLVFVIGKSSYQGYKREHPSANATTAQSDEFAELAAAAPAQLSPTGELSAMFNLMSENTDLQRKNKFKEIKGKIVEWTLPVYEVRQSGSGYAIQTEADQAVGAFVYITARNDQDKAVVEGLKTGSHISFKGVISDVTMRHLEIKPAILFQPGSAKPVAIEVQQTTPSQPAPEQNQRSAKIDITVIGSIHTGTDGQGSLDSDSDYKSYSFEVNSDIGKKILSACKEGDSCEIQAIVDAENNFSSIRLVKKAGL